MSRQLAAVLARRLPLLICSADLGVSDLSGSQEVGGEFDPVDPEAAINAQAQLMRELLGGAGDVAAGVSEVRLVE